MGHTAHVLEYVCRSLWELLRGKTVPKATRKFGGHFHSDAEHRDFTAIGTAAGLTHMPETVSSLLCCFDLETIALFLLPCKSVLTVW